MARPDGSFTHDPMRWLRLRSNEHHTVVPAALYAANVVLFHGDNRTLAVWCLLVLAATAALLIALRR